MNRISLADDKQINLMSYIPVTTKRSTSRLKTDG